MKNLRFYGCIILCAILFVSCNSNEETNNDYEYLQEAKDTQLNYMVYLNNNIDEFIPSSTKSVVASSAIQNEAEPSIDELPVYLQQYINLYCDGNHNTSNIEDLLILVHNDSCLNKEQKYDIAIMLGTAQYFEDYIVASYANNTRTASDCYDAYNRASRRIQRNYIVAASVALVCANAVGLAVASVVAVISQAEVEQDLSNCLAQ